MSCFLKLSFLFEFGNYLYYPAARIIIQQQYYKVPQHTLIAQICVRVFICECMCTYHFKQVSHRVMWVFMFYLCSVNDAIIVKISKQIVKIRSAFDVSCSGCVSSFHRFFFSVSLERQTQLHKYFTPNVQVFVSSSISDTTNAYNVLKSTVNWRRKCLIGCLWHLNVIKFNNKLYIEFSLKNFFVLKACYLYEME